MNKQLAIAAADIIAAVESELATEWYAHAVLPPRAQRVQCGGAPVDAPLDWRAVAIAVCVWLLAPAFLLADMWRAGVGG